MGEKIALGFHTCMDFELEWDTKKIERLIQKFEVYEEDIRNYKEGNIKTERELLIACLSYMQKGKGGELLPDTNKVCIDFAKRFCYRMTIGGTATRAAIAISKIGYESIVQLSCSSKYMKELLPAEVHYVDAVKNKTEEIYPHVILSYQPGIRICENDVDFVTPGENRIMISHDTESLYLTVCPEYKEYLKDAEVFLLSSFSEVLEEEVIEDRMKKVRTLFKSLPADVNVIMEDGCYIRKEIRQYVHHELRDMVDVLSMNEEELQEYAGHKINILNAHEILEVVDRVYRMLRVPTLLIHSSKWALTYGENAEGYRKALEGGIALASSRYCYGDDFGREEYLKIKRLSERLDSKKFCETIKKSAGEKICIVPAKDLSFAAQPTVVGLGDFFAGGLLPQLLVRKRERSL